MVTFLELGGYWVLSDLLERPQLRSESWKALSEALKFRRSRELSLAAYGASSVVFGIGLLGGANYGWWFIVGDLLKRLFKEGIIGWALMVPIIISMVVGWITLFFTERCAFNTNADD